MSYKCITMPCTYCHKNGHNKKTCPEYIKTISNSDECPSCLNSFSKSPFVMLNCGHYTCLDCVLKLGSSTPNYCTECNNYKNMIVSPKHKNSIDSNESNESNESKTFFPENNSSIMSDTSSSYDEISSEPPSPCSKLNLIVVNKRGVFYCKKTNTYIYNKVKFNTLRAAMNCRKAHIILGKETISIGNGNYLYDEVSFNSLETLRKKQSDDINNHSSSLPDLLKYNNETI